MANETDETVFDINFLKLILNNKSYTMELSFKVFLPWVSYAILTATYMTTCAENFDPITQNLDD